MSDVSQAQTLVGRDAELTALQAALAGALDGTGGLVALVGEPGIGKSALAAATAEEAARIGFAVASGRALDVDNPPRLYPLVPALRAVGLAGHPGLAAPPDDISAAFSLWEDVLGHLARASEPPRLWIIEDIHAADASTLDLLLFLVRSLRATRTLILVTVREREPRLTGAIRQRTSRLLLEGLRTDLAPLAPEAATALAARWGRALGAGDLARVVARAGGNPLYLRECARALGEVGVAPGRVAPVPATILAAVSERAERLPRATQTVLAAAAVLGDEVRASLLGRMIETLPARAIDDLSPAVAAGLLEELAPGHFRFAHALVREAIERAMTAEARAVAHARAEAALAALGDAPELLPERARHALETLAPERAAAIAALVDDAVATLERAGSFDRAFALLTRALSAREAGTLPSATPDDLARGAALARAAGQQGEHRRLALAAIAAARARGDARALARAALVLGAEIRPGVVDPALVQALEEAAATLEAGEAALRCRVRARLAAALQPAPDAEVPMAMGRAAIADARRLGDEALLCDVLHDATGAFVDVADPSEVTALASELASLARARRDPERALRARMRLALAEIEAGRFDAFADHVDEMLAHARAVGHPRLTWRPLLFASMRSVACGRFEESEAYLTEVERLEQLSDDPALFIALRAHRHMRAQIMHRRREVDAWLAAMAEHLPLVPEAAFMQPVLVALAAARLGEAVRPVPEGSLTTHFRSRGPGLLLAGIVGEIAAAAGTAGERARLRERLLPHAGQDLAFGHLGLSYEGPVERVLGLLDASLGDARSAAGRLERSRELCRRRALLPWVARIGFELGVLLVEADAGRAAAALDEAIEVSDGIGLPELAARARRARAGQAPQSPAKPRSPGVPPPLTIVREGDFWLLRQGDRAVRVRDSRGMSLLARLVERPREELHVLVLAGHGGEAAPESTAGPALDEEATVAYRLRLKDLGSELDAAEAAADLGTAQKLRREREFLQRELARAVGLGGVARQVGSATERARINVQRRIKDALGHIAAVEPELGAYLKSAIRTGTFCSFRP